LSIQSVEYIEYLAAGGIGNTTHDRALLSAVRGG
jgi:hypothetical protein